ncbi:MAG: Hsp20/alpha crystallin family protein [Phycisphaerae bacterium]|nr:Hsp20/alpha crystallin family protein [Phycisphaerae bacterium]
MNLIPWRNKGTERVGSEACSIDRFRSELDRAFESFFRGGGDTFDRLLSPVLGWGPAVDVSEDDKQVTVRAEIPGVDPKDLDVTVSGDTLTLSGEKKEETHEEKGGWYHAERRFGSFRRTLRLPAEVDADEVEATYQNGVLTVRLNKTERAVGRRIAINKGGE